ncbi:branched-chain amino acid ABC transporter permease [Dactylosporangium sp. CA-092794]|uniref:branched-chain amino acid ABC transporter permease n=1 Tax=Dactylosporangium sp. CA-092794 TaxID=3239929 RepID=UPI003D8F3325
MPETSRTRPRSADLARLARTYAGPLITAIVLLVFYAGDNPFWIYNLTLVATYAIVVVGLNVFVGYLGLVTFAQTAFMAIGGYSLAILTVRHGWNPWAALLAGLLLSVIAAAAVGVPLLRLRGHYLTMTTFALALGTFGYITGATSFTGGSVGISGVPPLAVGPFSLANPRDAYLGCWIVVAVVTWIGVRLRNSHVGRAWQTISSREEAGTSLGLRVQRFKVIGFVLAAVFAAVGGALYVSFTTYLSPDLYDSTIGVNLFVMLFLGGRGRTLAPIVGAAVLILVPQQFSALSDYQAILFDCVLLVIILLKPGGLLEPPQWLLRLGRRDRGTAPPVTTQAEPVRQDAPAIGADR